MNDELFRKKSLEKVKSPESLNDYIRVSNPGVWLLLVAIILILVGYIIWGVFGKLENTIDSNLIVSNKTYICYVYKDYEEKINEALNESSDGLKVKINDNVVGTIIKEIDNPYTNGTYSNYVAYSIKLDTKLNDGDYNSSIVVTEIKPLSFVIN